MQTTKKRVIGQFELPNNVVVVAPHPDDETLACGGLLHDVTQAGQPARVVVITDGQSYRDACIFWREGRIPKATETCTLAEMDAFGVYRRKEVLNAMRALGVIKKHVHFLGAVDSTLAEAWEHWNEPPKRLPFGSPADPPPRAEVTGAMIIESLRKVFAEAAQEGPLTVFTTHPRDGHADHRAAYQFVREALEDIDSPTRVVTSVVHCYSHNNCTYPNPPQTLPIHSEGHLNLKYVSEDPSRISRCRATRLAPDTMWEPASDHDYGEVQSFELSTPARRAKHAAIQAHQTQIGLTSRNGNLETTHRGWVDAIGFLNAFEHPNELFYPDR